MPLNVHDSGRFVFGLDRSVELDPERGRLVIILLALLTLILAGAFLSMRSILRLVRWLHEGVREVGRGNLKHRVPLKRSYELRDLAAAFNDMTDRIQDMLHTKEKLMLDVSHELRLPLTRMNVALEFLPEGKAKDSQKSDIAEMETMINEILETARMHHLHGNLKRQLIYLRDHLEGVLAEYVNQPPGLQAGDFPADIELNNETDERRTSNIERPTSNNVFCQFKITKQACAEKWLRSPGANLSFESCPPMEASLFQPNGISYKVT